MKSVVYRPAYVLADDVAIHHVMWIACSHTIVCLKMTIE
jgi:hypothetical protein